MTNFYKSNDPTSIHWYTAEEFFSLVYAQAAQHDMPLGEFIRRFRGLTATSTAKRLATSYRRTSDISTDKLAVMALYEAMKSACKPIQPKALCAVGETGLLSGLQVTGTHWYKQAALLHDGKPYLFEILIAETEGNGESGFMINRAMVFGDFLSGYLFFNDSDYKQRFGINGLLYFIDPKNVTVIAHLMGVGLAFKDYGKGQIDLPRPVINEIQTAIEKAGKTLEKYFKRRLRGENAELRKRQQAEREGSWNQKDAVLDLLPKAIALATDNGTLPCNVRGLYYKVRPLLQSYTEKALDYGYFSQTLWPAYCQANGKNTLIYNDSRGILIEPHTEGTFQLGTFDVRDYVIPNYHYNKILFVEKRGLLQVLIADDLHKRYDMALIGSEGYATEAVRDLLSKMQTNEDYTIFVLHDADPDGYNISRTLQEATRRMPTHSIDVIDIGLTIADAVAMELESETFTRKKELAGDLALTTQELEYFSGTRKGNIWTGCRRFELNALGSRELVNYIEAALKASDTPPKVIPPVKVQTGQANNYLKTLISGCVDNFYDLDKIKADLCEKYALEDQNFSVDSYLEKHPNKPWQDAIRRRVNELFVKIAVSVNEDLNS